jgi:thiosulfate/3-mercaptopyruvate sulfurtransferase
MLVRRAHQLTTQAPRPALAPPGNPMLIGPMEDTFAAYAHPEALVSTAWLANHLNDPGLRIVESNEDVLLYDTGHIPGAVHIDWRADLNDPLVRDYIGPEAFRRPLRPPRHLARHHRRLLRRQIELVGLLRLLGVPALRPHQRQNPQWRSRQMDRRRPSAHQGSARPRPRPLPGPARPPRRGNPRVLRRHPGPHAGRRPLIDVRSPKEFSGETTHMPEYPQEGVLRGGHIPGARSVPWATAANPDGTFKDAATLREIYTDTLGLKPDDAIVAYCRIGERSSHTWFVLKYLLGYQNVRNYDGSWTEWGNMVRSPIERS